jgi:hypothetical protein
MRLLQLKEDGDYQLTRDLVGDDQIPAYAILSHTWGPDTDEVNFEDISEGTGKQKPGYEKLQFCAAQAKIDGLQYFWVDTCCIKKASDAELSEAINTMFRWYHGAAKCYVYLSDVATGYGQGNDQAWLDAFKRSRWHTRGWTLQELIAPRSVEFFASTRRRLGDKRSLEKELHEITGLPELILQGGSLSDYEIDKRLSWMDGRRTKRDEDQAYALLGLFEVHMPLIYGEGKKNAIRRLKDEIDRSARVKGLEDAGDQASQLQPQDEYYLRLSSVLRLRSQLHSTAKRSDTTPHWEVLHEDNLPDTIKRGRGPTDRWIGGTYQMSYPTTNPVASILLTVDWHAFEGNPTDPVLEWRIHTPQSLYHPGTHTGRVTCTERRDPFKSRCFRVWVDSPIYSPFVAQSPIVYRNGATSSEGALEDMAPLWYQLDHILQSVAHFLAYGPWYDDLPTGRAPFRFHLMEGRANRQDRDAFARASSFWARAYTMPEPDEFDFLETGLSEECRQTTVTAIRELMEVHGIPMDKTWDFETSLKAATSQREWALEERKWADRLRAIIFSR